MNEGSFHAPQRNQPRLQALVTRPARALRHQPTRLAAWRIASLGLLLASLFAMADLHAADTATARLAPTAGNKVSGMLTFSERAGGGVRLVGEITGLAPDSTHGFHIHEKGDCSSPDAMSAGEHFNPGAQVHGDPAGKAHHAGDLPNLKADAKGGARLALDVPGLMLEGKTGVVGRALVVHRDADDFKSQPAGNSGARLACAVIERAR